MSERYISEADAQAALDAVKKQFNVEGCTPPFLVRDWEYLHMKPNATPWAIVWEEGPHEWAYRSPHGGRDFETTLLVRDHTGDEEYVADTPPAAGFPENVFAEPVTYWALGLYPA